MKKLLMIALIAISTSAYAAEAPSSSAAYSKAGTHQNFDERKALRLQHISDKIAELQKAQSCVQAATDAKAMKACNSGRHWRRHDKGASPAAPASDKK